MAVVQCTVCLFFEVFSLFPQLRFVTLLQTVENLSIEQFISQATIEALTITILPRAAWFNVSRLYSHCLNPVSYGFSDELRAVV